MKRDERNDDIPDWAKEEDDAESMWSKTDEKVERDVGDVKDDLPNPITKEDADAEEEENEVTAEDTDTDAEEDEDEENEDEEEIIEVEEDEEDYEAVDESQELTPSPDTTTLDEIAPTETTDDEKKEEITTPLNLEKGTDSRTDDEKAVKSRSTRSFKYSPSKLHEKFIKWLDGTPEKPLPVFSLKAKFKRWRLIHFHNHVWLRIMSYDKNTHEYTIYENLIPRSKLPKTSVHCTNEKNVYFDKLFDVPYEPWKDNGFGAINAYLYMKDKSMDEALLMLWQGPKMNIRTLAIIGIVVVAALFYMFYMMQG